MMAKTVETKTEKVNGVILTLLVSLLVTSPSLAAVHKIQSGDTLTHIMKRHGFTLKNVAEVASSSDWDSKFPLVRGQKYVFDNRILKIYHPDYDYHLQIQQRKDGAVLKKEPSQFTTKLRRVTGQIRGSLINSIKSLNISESIAYRFIDAYVLDLRPKSIQSGSKFSIVVEELFEGERFIRFGDIVSARLQHHENLIEKSLFEIGESKVMVDETDLNSNRPFYAPVDRLKFTSLFQPRRRHPITGRRQPHLGIDFEMPTGAPVYAAAAGQVEKTARSRAGGKYIVIRHNNGMRSYYNHLNAINEEIKKGVWVFTGQTLGEVGCTGWCTKPHLHFAVKSNGRMINPIRLIRPYPRHVESRLLQLVARANK